MAESPKEDRSPLGRLVGVTIGVAFLAGDLVAFEIEVLNQGAVPATNIVVVDYLFSPRNPDPVVVSRAPDDHVEVVVQGNTARMVGGGCDREIALVKP